MKFKRVGNTRHHGLQSIKTRNGIIFLVALSLAVCSRSLWAADEGLVLTGSSTVAPLALEIGKRFETQNPAVRIDVQTGGSSRGIHDARLGLADIGMVSRALKDSEQDLVAYTIAMDGICIIVHQDNPIESLTDRRIIDIYTGKIHNWQEAGGPDGIITVVNKAEGRSTLELFLQYFSLKNSQIKAQVIVGDNQQGIKTVAGSPGAIGYVSIGSAEYEQEHGAAIKRLPLDGQPATLAAVRNGQYPLARPLNLVIKGEGSALVKQFIDFARSSAVDDLVEAQYFVPVAH
ncbi:MAG: phosphate ABC transporter substrate-binding protein [Methylococcales bacterium]